MGSDSIPPKTLSDESIDRGLVCAYMHSITQTLKILTFMHSCLRRMNAGNKDIPSMHHPQRWNVTTSMVGLKNGHMHKNLTQNGEGNAEKKEGSGLV